MDHISMEKDGIIYESTVGKGVQDIPFEEWKKGREGTFLLIYEVPDDFLDFDIHDIYKGTKYDLKSIINIMLNRFEKLKKNPTDKIYCSEYYAMMRGHEDFYQWSPARAERELSLARKADPDNFEVYTDYIPLKEPNIIIGG